MHPSRGHRLKANIARFSHGERHSRDAPFWLVATLMMLRGRSKVKFWRFGLENQSFFSNFRADIRKSRGAELWWGCSTLTPGFWSALTPAPTLTPGPIENLK